MHEHVGVPIAACLYGANHHGHTPGQLLPDRGPGGLLHVVYLGVGEDVGIGREESQDEDTIESEGDNTNDKRLEGG